MWKWPQLLKRNILVSPIQFLLHSQPLNEGPHLCPPSFPSNLSRGYLRVGHRNEVGVDRGTGGSRVSVAQI